MICTLWQIANTVRFCISICHQTLCSLLNPLSHYPNPSFSNTSTSVLSSQWTNSLNFPREPFNWEAHDIGHENYSGMSFHYFWRLFRTAQTAECFCCWVLETITVSKLILTGVPQLRNKIKLFPDKLQIIMKPILWWNNKRPIHFSNILQFTTNNELKWLSLTHFSFCYLAQ